MAFLSGNAAKGAEHDPASDVCMFINKTHGGVIAVELRVARFDIEVW